MHGVNCTIFLFLGEKTSNLLQVISILLNYIRILFSFFCFIAFYVYIHMCLHVCPRMFMCACVPRGQGSKLDAFLICSPLYFFVRVLFLCRLPRMAGQKLQDSSVSSSPVLGWQVCNTVSRLCMILRLPTQVLMPVQQALGQLSHLLNSPHFFEIVVFFQISSL